MSSTTIDARRDALLRAIKSAEDDLAWHEHEAAYWRNCAEHHERNIKNSKNEIAGDKARLAELEMEMGQ